VHVAIFPIVGDKERKDFIDLRSEAEGKRESKEYSGELKPCSLLDAQRPDLY
jgi:hypothetical protein